MPFLFYLPFQLFPLNVDIGRMAWASSFSFVYHSTCFLTIGNSDKGHEAHTMFDFWVSKKKIFFALGGVLYFQKQNRV